MDAPTNAISGYGVVLQRGDTTGPTGFSDITEIVKITGGGISVSFDDASHSQSPSGFEEMIPLMAKVKDLTVELNLDLDNSSQEALIADAELGPSQPLRYWKVKMPPKDNPRATWTFRARVADFDPVTDITKKQTATLILKVSGPLQRS